MYLGDIDFLELNKNEKVEKNMKKDRLEIQTKVWIVEDLVTKLFSM